MGNKPLQSRNVAAVFDRWYSERHRKELERWVVGISVAGFLGHLGHIFLARSLPNPTLLIAAAGKNYLSAISTPFNFILFYEVLILISAIPASTTQSLAKQFEIVSLVFVRGFFADIAKLDLANLRAPVQELAPAFGEVGGGLLMFLLVTVFQHAARRKSKVTGAEMTEELRKFVDRKKLLALGLTVLFVSLAIIEVCIWAFGVYRDARRGSLSSITPPTQFYSDVFTVMIFTDVLILILSLLVSDSYELVFRNAAFVISTVLIRFSLTAGHPYGVALGVVGMVFGIVTVLIYNYNSGIHDPGAWASG